MKKLLLLLTLILSVQFSVATAQTQVEIDGVVMPRTLQFKGKTISLNGIGQRSKFFTDLYVQGLYLTVLSQDPKRILESETEMAIRIHVTSSLISSKKLSKALEKGMEKSVGKEGVLKFAKELQELEALLSTEDTKVGDYFDLAYSPIDNSLWITKNDVSKGKIAGIEFKKAFFGIWLSDKPVDEDLKKNLLGIYN